MKIPCSGTFKTLNFRYHAPISQCDTDIISNHTVQYAVNLILFEKMFDTNEMIADHKSLLDAKPSVYLPNLTIHLEASYKALGLIQNTLLSLDNAVNASLEDRKSYMSVADQMKNEFKPMETPPVNLANIIETFLIFVNPILAGLALFFAFYIYTKQRTMLNALSLLGAVRSSDAASILGKKIYIPDVWKRTKMAIGMEELSPTITSPPRPNYYQVTLPEWHTLQNTQETFRSNITAILAVILVLLLISFVAKILARCLPCLKCCIRKKKETETKESSDEELLQFKLFLAIGANDKYMLIEVLTAH